MRVDLTINDVGKTWQFMNEQVWAVKSNGKSYSFYSQHKPVIGSFIPCMVEERQGATKEGKAIIYRDARPIPKEILNDDVPNYHTPTHDVSQEMRGFVRPAEGWEGKDAGKLAAQPLALDPETPEWAKPGPKPKLIGVEVIVDTLKNHFTDQEKEGMNFWQGFFSLAATVCRDFNDGKLEIDYLTVEDKERLT